MRSAVQGRRRRDGAPPVGVVAVAAMIALAATFVGCGSNPATESTTDSRPIPSEPPATSSPGATAPSGSPGSTPTTAVDDTGAVVAYQASPSEGPCTLARVRDDFGDYPVPPEPYPLERTLEPVAGSVEVATPWGSRALSRTGDWFTIADNGLARLDPVSGTAQVVFTAGACTVELADATDDEVAVLSCEHGVSEARSGCSIVVASIADGTTTATWAADDLATGGLALDGEAVVVVEGYQRHTATETVPARVLRFDARTGAGVEVTPTFCPDQPSLDHPIQRTSLVIASCLQDGVQETLIVDGRTGAVVGRFPYRGSTFAPTSDGVEVRLNDGSRWRAEDFTEIAPSDIAPEVWAALDPELGPLAPDVFVVPAMLWTSTAVASASGEDQREIALRDASGAIIERWLAATGPSDLPRTGSRSSVIVAADTEGAWLSTDGVLYRLHRS